MEEIDNVHEPLRRQDSQPKQSGKRSRSDIHDAPVKEAENSHSQRLCHDAQTAVYSAGEIETIAHSRRLHRQDQTAHNSTAAIKISSEVAPAAAAAAPARPSGSRVTRSQGITSDQALSASPADPFTDTEPMQRPQ